MSEPPEAVGAAERRSHVDALALGLTSAEYELICDKQGRSPNQVELAMYSLMWSEHCAYKHSKKLLRTLPTEGPHVVMGPGENAGAVDVGGGLVCAFKVESHNHPSAVEPFQGAATGVGGILRDIFAIGARPIAVLDSLRFGEPQLDLRYSPHPGGNQGNGRGGGARSRYLLDGAVSGIGHYGNSIGVPTVGGEVYFEGPYEQNCLVNAMALGLARREQLVRSAAAGVGNVLVLFGASTGRDGIGGASVLASAELGEGRRRDKRPTVQVGDPFEEKKLLECSLELLERGLLVALQDLGAAGLTSAAAEMASKGEVGIDIDVARVPLREPGMEPFEIMVCESQERMLCVGRARGRRGGAGVVREVGGRAAPRSGPSPTAAGSGSSSAGSMGGSLATSSSGTCRCGRSSTTARCTTSRRRSPPSRSTRRRAPTLSRDAGPREALLALLACPNIASRRPLFEQYDAIVQSRTVRRPEQADAAVLALPAHAGGWGAPVGGARRCGARRWAKGRRRRVGRRRTRSCRPTDAPPGAALAVSIDCNGRRVAADPYRGTVEAVLECASNLACVGAEPLGTTNNLNFGNPEKPHIAWQLTEAVRGLGDACRALGAPIVGGNVSLYNEGPRRADLPDARDRHGRPPARRAPRRAPRLRARGRRDRARRPVLPVAGRGRAGQAARRAAARRTARDRHRGGARRAVRRPRGVRAGVLSSAHDIAEGGLAVALAECCLAGDRGATIALDSVGSSSVDRSARSSMGLDSAGGGPVVPGRVAVETLSPPSESPPAWTPVETLARLFGEGPGGFVVSGAEDALRELGERTPVRLLGRVGGDRCRSAPGISASSSG